MRTIRYLLLLLLVAGAASPLAAQAAPFKSAGECVVGRHVADGSNKSGVVLSINQGTMCHVKLDSGGDSYYLFWMLHAAGGSGESDAKLRPGAYKCYNYSGGHLNYTFMDIQITGANSYRSGGQSFRFHEIPQTRQLVFENGPLAGRPAKVGDGPSIVIGATTCDLDK
jgi:hypothetical protein